MKRDFDIIIEDEIKELANLKLPDPNLLDYYNRASRREIFWNSAVDDTLADITMMILDWNREDKGKSAEERQPIKIYISSDGGAVDPTLNFIDIVTLSKTPVYTIAMSRAYSSGGLMLLSGHKRFIFPNTTFLLHDGSMGAIGDTSKVMDRMELTQKQEKKIKEFVLDKTTLTSKMYDKNYRKDWFLASDEIIKFGFADKIITDLDEIL
jgi:ATP-dependent Clp protease protease subunit